MNFATPRQQVKRFGKSLKHAFAIGPANTPLSPEEAVLLEKLATVVVQRGMATPAVLLLETLGPMNFLGSQVLHGITPLVSLACSTQELERAAWLLERRDALPTFITRIEAKEKARTSTP